ncbi:MAG: hypothetical protein AB1656_17775 [Candidatus Omnitrophota bacterium]
MNDPEREQLNERLKELLRILRKNPDDRIAFQEFYRLLHSPLTGFFINRLKFKLGYRSDLKYLVEEGLQEVFLRLHQKQYQYDESFGAKPTTWIFQFAVYVTNEIIRRIQAQEHNEMPIDKVSDSDAASQPDSLSEIMQEEDWKALIALIHKLLSPEEAIIVLLKSGIPTRDLEIDDQAQLAGNIKHADIARILNEVMSGRNNNWEHLTPVNAQKRYARALICLRDFLNRGDGDKKE